MVGMMPPEVAAEEEAMPSVPRRWHPPAGLDMCRLFTTTSLFYSVGSMAADGSMICGSSTSPPSPGERLKSAVPCPLSDPVRLGPRTTRTCTSTADMTASSASPTSLPAIWQRTRGPRCHAEEPRPVPATSTPAVCMGTKCLPTVATVDRNVLRICLHMISRPVSGRRWIARQASGQAAGPPSWRRCTKMRCSFSVATMETPS
mmetsp:Transcript_28898/g.67801  ORF Transcript_28898/g.67801 Transcript_28898/m.67801 type:complete len:203 (-) Transcript_28898:804-1412(-)